MNNTFEVEDLFNVLITLEEKGKKLYEELESLSDNPEIKELYRSLAGQEDEHTNIFKKLKKENVIYDNAELTPEYFNYVNVLLKESTKAYDNLEIKTHDEGIEFATKLEKDTIMLLHELKSVVTNDSADVISKLIKEEQNHLTKVLKLK